MYADEIDEALALAQKGKFKDAIDMIMPSAENDNPESQYWLARFYGPSGIGNKEENIKWLLKAVESGSADAQYLLANTFLELNNLAGYRDLLYKAARNNHAQAQYDIAFNLSDDWIEASIETLVEIIYWYERSGYNGNSNAYNKLGVLYDDETAEIENRRMIFYEMEIEAYNGNAMAQFNMGWIYARGLLKPNGELMRDLDIARGWFQKSASLNFEDAIATLKKHFQDHK